jgi:murein DD-endopeptidase MepM/ murein hydrolase activator NlpD
VKTYTGGVRHDYKHQATATGGRGRRWSWFLLGLSLPTATVALLLVSEPNESKIPTSAEISANTKLKQVPLQIPQSSAPAQRAPEQADAAAPKAASEFEGERLKLIVERGDSLERLFRHNDLRLADLAAMVELEDASRYLKLLRPGDEIGITHDGDHVLSLEREIDDFNMLSIVQDGDGYSASKIPRNVDVRTVSAHGIIQTSLFEAGVEAGISDALTMNMAGIFQWDIDFIKDVRIGDEFTVIYEELWRDGKKLRNGNILAAEFVNQGKDFRAARYTDASGRSDYYTPKGRSVRKAFLRAPVDFTRISSTFNLHRKHPILNTIRAHTGVDYAAPTGTPVKAAGDGKVIFRGKKGGYGNAVILKHGGNVTTLYGHLSRFGKYRVGRRVQQGDIIGYVGMTGLATGPHLHYEYRIAGVHRNPRTVPLPPADPVPAESLADFKATVAPMWRQLDLYERTRLAATAAAD